ncbi:MAG: Ig-like domain-containing protein, partial [Actinomycetota bacterium]|nr:Ig-like domain-containing protein [Actinomycetota bacterium]
IQVRVDNTLPTGDVTFPATAANIRGTVALTSNSADGGSGVATVQFQRSPIGANTWTNQAASFDTTTVTDGQYDLRVVTTDNAGNSFSSAAITVRVDNTLPSGSVTAPAAAANVRTTITLTSDSADAGSGVATVVFQRSPQGANTWTNQAASWDTTLQADGQYDVRVITTDNAGNGFTSSEITIRVDNTLPTGSVTGPANGAEIGVPAVALTSDSADGGSGVGAVVFERSPAGANTWTATAASWNTASGPDSVGDGNYDLRVTTTDNAGNSFTSPVITVKVDHTAPTTTASLAPGTPSNAPVTVTFSANDGTGSGVSTTTCVIDGTLTDPCVVPAPGDHSNDGSHVVQFFSTDDVGNVESTKSVTVVIDTTAPSGTGGNPGDYLRGIANLTYSTGATDVSSVQFQFSVAGANAWSNVGAADLTPPYEASWNTALVADGPYDLRAVVTDSTGNVANTLLPGLPKTVDNTAPAGNVTSPAAAAFVSGTINVTASATDGATPPASGVSAVRFEIKPSGSGSFSVYGTQTTPVVGSTYQQSLASASYPDGPADLRVVITDVAGNETTSAVRTVSLDNVAPAITLNDPGAAISGTINLGVTTDADTTQVVFERSVSGANSWTTIATDNTSGDGFTASFSTVPLGDGVYDLRARATDGGGNSSTSGLRTTRIDNTLPTGSVTSPGDGATVGGPAVQLSATAADTSGSGIASVSFEVKAFGSGSFSTVGSDTTNPYSITWDSTAAPDGATEIRALITDAAGNMRTTSVVLVTVDSTGPSVNLADPGPVVSGSIDLSATTGGAAVRVSFGVTPAGTGSWTEISSDTSAPFNASFDTATLGDGLYDLRAIGYDAVGNPSTPSVRATVRFDNTAPRLVSSTPADGSVSDSANEIVLRASEPVTAPGALLDGVAAPAATASGNELTFATGALADGLHVLSGELEDASGTRTRFRVAVTIDSSPSDDPPPIERSITSSGSWTITVPGGLVTVNMPEGAWPTPPTPEDYILVLRVDAGSSTAAGPGFAPGTQIVEVTARWAVAGTYVTEFREPIEIILSNPNAVPAIPAWSQNGTTSWKNMPPLSSPTLPVGQPDGFYRNGSAVHVLTHHLTFFGLRLDDEAPSAPRDVAGVVAGDGLTLRWIPGTDSSGQLSHVVLFVNGEPYRNFGQTELETKLGDFVVGDTRRFTFAQVDAAGNASGQTRPLRAVPAIAGKGFDQAVAELAAAGFQVGNVREETIPSVAPGTVVQPAGVRLALESSAIDLVVARGGGVGEARLVFSVTGSKKLTLQKTTAIPVRIKVSKPAEVSATLFGAKKQRLYSWKLRVKAGANVVKLRLPQQIRRPGAYTLTWVARSGKESVRRTLKLTLVGPKLAQVKPKRQEVEVVLAGEKPENGALRPSFTEGGPRVVAQSATPDETFTLAASAARDVGVVVVDVDAYGISFLSDLRTVFPSLRLIAISREPARRTLAVRAGAVLALPRTTTAKQLGKAISLVASR